MLLATSFNSTKLYPVPTYKFGMEGKDSTDGPPCLCRLDSNGDYILVSKDTETIPPDNNFHIREMAASGTISRANHKAKNIFMQMSSVFFPVLHNDCCTCQGWKQWPSDDDPEHSIDANHVLQSVSFLLILNCCGYRSEIWVILVTPP